MEVYKKVLFCQNKIENVVKYEDTLECLHASNIVSIYAKIK